MAGENQFLVLVLFLLLIGESIFEVFELINLTTSHPQPSSIGGMVTRHIRIRSHRL